MAEHGTKFEVTVEKLVYGGEGLSRLDSKVIFTPYVLPAERVAVEAVREAGWCGHGRLKYAIAGARRSALPISHAAAVIPAHAVCFRQAKREILERCCAAWGRSSRLEIGIVSASRGVIATGRSFGARRPDRLSGRAVAFAVPGGDLPDQFARQYDPGGAGGDGARPASGRHFCGRSRSSPGIDVQLNVLETDKPVAQRFFDWSAEKIRAWSRALEYPLDGLLSGERLVLPGEPVSRRQAGGSSAGERREGALDLCGGGVVLDPHGATIWR